MKMHRWGKDSHCIKCGMLKIVEKQEDSRFVLTTYVDLETGEKFLRAPDCSEKLVPVVPPPIDNQLKLFS